LPLSGLWSLFAAVICLVGAIAGWETGSVIVGYLRTKDVFQGPEVTYVMVGFVIIGLLLGFLFSTVLFRWLVNLITHLEHVSLQDKLFALVGMVLGLVVAILVTYPFARGNNPMGPPLTMLAIVICVFLGLGTTMSARKQLAYIFPKLAKADAMPSDLVSTAMRKVMDTNIIIDGRIAGICASGFLEGPLYVPGFVLTELHRIADSADNLKRARGRRGLDVLNKIGKTEGVELHVLEEYGPSYDENDGVDIRLVKLAKDIGAAVVTNDFNLNKIAELHGVTVLNVNELANALKPVFLPGEELTVTIVKEGKEPGQGVAYLDDGTMVVVEAASKHIGQLLTVCVTSVYQTVAGKMIFAEVAGAESQKEGRR
jgi:uncharacterized protein YacL